MTRSEAVREAFATLGIDASIEDITKYLKKKKLEPVDSSLFYHIRRKLRSKEDIAAITTMRNASEKEVKLPKRLDISEVRKILGDHEADRLLTAFLHKKASQIRPITPEQVDNARQFLDGINSSATRSGFYHAAMKWILESSAVKGNFVRFLNNLGKEVQNG